jgi:hypothetical protein
VVRLAVYSFSCERVGRSRTSSAVVVSSSGHGVSSRSEAAATVTTCMLLCVESCGSGCSDSGECKQCMRTIAAVSEKRRPALCLLQRAAQQ